MIAVPLGGRQYEEAAADLGATQFRVMYRVMLPLLAPAVFASAVLVFSSVILLVVIIGYAGYRWMTRGERGGRIEALATIAGSD